MLGYPQRARERAMKVEEVILRVVGKRLTFWQAAWILRISPRHLRRGVGGGQARGLGGPAGASNGGATALAALREVVEQRGIFCALYTDRGSHFWLTPKAGEIVDRQRMTQIGRAMRELDVEMIPAYSPQARGRSERNFGTWQGRLPQELRMRGITTVEEANRFLRESYIAELNRKFSVPAAQPESAFVPASGRDLDRIFSVQQERVEKMQIGRAHV